MTLLWCEGFDFYGKEELPGIKYIVCRYLEPVTGQEHNKEHDAEREAVNLGLGIFLGDMFEPDDGITIERKE